MFVSHQCTAMEGRGCTNAIRLCSSGPDDERSAHAVALRADLSARVDLLLRIQKSDVGGRIFFGSTRSISEAFELTFDNARTRRKCRVIWRTNTQLGVSFEGA